MGTPIYMLDDKEDTSELVNSVLKELHQQEQPAQSQPQQQSQQQQQVNQPMEPTQNIQYVVHEDDDSDENNLFNELKTPVLFAVLYLLLSLPTFRSLFVRLLPNLFGSGASSSAELFGNLLKALLGGVVFYLISKFAL